MLAASRPPCLSGASPFSAGTSRSAILRTVSHVACSECLYLPTIKPILCSRPLVKGIYVYDIPPLFNIPLLDRYRPSVSSLVVPCIWSTPAQADSYRMRLGFPRVHLKALRDLKYVSYEQCGGCTCTVAHTVTASTVGPREAGDVRCLRLVCRAASRPTTPMHAIACHTTSIDGTPSQPYFSDMTACIASSSERHDFPLVAPPTSGSAAPPRSRLSRLSWPP